jgi:hypothetical protein
MQTKRLFCFYQAVLRTIAVSLNGLLGVKHRLAITPAARRPNSQRGIGQHALDQGGRQQEHGRNRWLKATLARHKKCALWARVVGFHPWGGYA